MKSKGLVLVLWVGLFVACAGGSDNGNSDDGDPNDGTPDPVATILTDTHGLGGSAWNYKWCFDCHGSDESSPDLPNDANHVPEPDAPACAACHGGNGSCAPPNNNDHNSLSSCNTAECHGNMHSYVVAADCIACHLAAEGTSDCH